MPKKISSHIDERIISEVGRHPDGIGIESLHGKLDKESLSRRTLQRRLVSLMKEGNLKGIGKGRARRYQALPPDLGASLDINGFIESEESNIPLSPEGEAIRAHVRQPRHLRKPTSYNQRFLDAYFPNKTFYLPEELRNQLHEVGRSHAVGQVAGTFGRDILNRLLIDLSWASSRLEGNTYNRLDTERLIEFGQEAEGKDSLETQMILNHKAAIEMLVNESDLIGFNPQSACPTCRWAVGRPRGLRSYSFSGS